MLHIKRFQRLFKAIKGNAPVLLSRSSSVDYTYKNYNVTRRDDLNKVNVMLITCYFNCRNFSKTSTRLILANQENLFLDIF